MNQYFGENFPKLRLTALQFDCLVDAFLPYLSAAFDAFNLSAEFYATQWFLTLFAYSLPLPHVIRVWDQFLCRGMKFIHRVGLALLQEARPALLGLSFDETVQVLRNIGHSIALSPEALIAAALEFKVTNQLLCDLEHALTAGSGAGLFDGNGRSLPLCFPERDLDSGTTRCKLAPVASAYASEQSGTLLPRKGDSAAFLDASLPLPRIPGDPVANQMTLADELSKDGEDIEQMPARRRKLKQLPAAMLRAVRRHPGRRKDQTAVKQPPQIPASASVPITSFKTGDIGQTSQSNDQVSSTRSSSLPCGKRSQADLFSRAPHSVRPPDHVPMLKVRNLDTG